MLFGDPDELKAEKALAFRTLTRALADLIGIVEHGGKVGSEVIEDEKMRTAPAAAICFRYASDRAFCSRHRTSKIEAVKREKPNDFSGLGVGRSGRI
jgi:hypothetical protein